MEIGARQLHESLQGHLGVNKISASWVSRLLGSEQEMSGLDLCCQLQELLACYDDRFWQRILTTDKTWIPYFNPDTKDQSKVWRESKE